MAKFGYQEDNDYNKVSGYLQEMAEEAAAKIEHQWKIEDAHLQGTSSMRFAVPP